MKLKFCVISRNHVTAEVLLMYCKDDDTVTRRETHHITWRNEDGTWRDCYGRPYPLPPPTAEELVPVKKLEKSLEKQSARHSCVTVTLIKSLGPGEGVFEIKEAKKSKRHVRLIQVRGEQWRLAQGNKFYRVPA